MVILSFINDIMSNGLLITIHFSPLYRKAHGHPASGQHGQDSEHHPYLTA
jgi:hypothetical protein